LQVIVDSPNLVYRLIVANPGQPTDDKQSLKWVWLRHVNHLNFGGHQLYLRNGWS